MADGDIHSVPGLTRSLVQDTRELMREEIAHARTEIREEISAARALGIAFASAALAAMAGVVLLCIAIGGAIAYELEWPVWTGHAIMAVLLLGGALGVVQYGRRQLGAFDQLPKTTETGKQNVASFQSKSG